jgi:PKD repeat protein
MVSISYWFDEGDSSTVEMEGTGLDGNGNGTYTFWITIPNDSTEPLFYLLEVLDAAGNGWPSMETKVIVLDVTDPEAVAGDDITVDQHQEVTFDGTASSDNVGVTVWTWILDDGGMKVNLEGPEPSYLFHRAGTYKVTLTVQDAFSNSHSDELEVRVRDITPPIPDAGMDIEVIQNSTVVFDGTGSTDNVGITSWTWYFTYGGMERELEGQNPRFIFYDPGVYVVILEVDDKAGNSNSTSLTLTVRDVIFPQARTQGDIESKVDEEVTFNGTGSSDNVGVVNWTWTIEYASGRVVEVYGPVVHHTFDQPGDHRVTLTVRDADGNQDTARSFNVHVPNVMLWMILLLIIVVSIGCTAGLALWTRWKVRKMDEARRGHR